MSEEKMPGMPTSAVVSNSEPEQTESVPEAKVDLVAPKQARPENVIKLVWDDQLFKQGFKLGVLLGLIVGALAMGLGIVIGTL